MGGCASTDHSTAVVKRKKISPYKSADQLQDFNKLFLGETNSALKRNLT